MTTHLHNTTDAAEWAKVWLDTIRRYPNIPYDEGAMIGWFANAIMAGYDARPNNGIQPTDEGSMSKAKCLLQEGQSLEVNQPAASDAGG